MEDDIDMENTENVIVRQLRRSFLLFYKQAHSNTRMFFQLEILILSCYRRNKESQVLRVYLVYDMASVLSFRLPSISGFIREHDDGQNCILVDNGSYNNPRRMFLAVQ